MKLTAKLPLLLYVPAGVALEQKQPTRHQSQISAKPLKHSQYFTKFDSNIEMIFGKTMSRKC